MTDRQKAIISILLFSICGGSTGAVTKIGLHHIPPLSFAFLRFLVASFIVLPVLVSLKRNIRQDLLTIAPLSLLGTLNITFFVLGLRLTTANIANVLYGATPLLTVLILYALHRQYIDRLKLTGIVLGFIGVLLVVLLPLIEKGQPFSGNLVGNVIVGIAVICWSFYMVNSKAYQKRYTPFVMTSMFILTSTALLLPIFLYDLSANFGWWQQIETADLLSLLYVATASTIGTYLLSQYAIKHGGAVIASLSMYLAPVFGFSAAFLLLGEKLTQGLVLGSILAIFGVYLTTTKESRS